MSIEQTIADNFIKAIKSELISKDKVATGKTINGIKSNIRRAGDSIEISVSAPKSIIYINKGRKKGKMPPKGSLIEWMIARGIPKYREDLIRQNIAERGIKPVPVIDRATQSVKQANERLILNINKRYIKTLLKKEIIK